MKFKVGDKVMTKISGSDYAGFYRGVVVKIANFTTNFPILVLVEKDKSPTPFAVSEVYFSKDPNDIMKGIL